MRDWNQSVANAASQSVYQLSINNKPYEGLKLAGWCQPRHLLLSINNKLYEGLKHAQETVSLWKHYFQLTINPMRDWNDPMLANYGHNFALSINNKPYEGLKHLFSIAWCFPNLGISFQLTINPMRDWNNKWTYFGVSIPFFQLIINPMRDWNLISVGIEASRFCFQLTINPMRDWN